MSVHPFQHCRNISHYVARRESEHRCSIASIACVAVHAALVAQECREALLNLGVTDVIRRLSANPDPTQQKYLQRIQQKLAGAAPTPAR